MNRRRLFVGILTALVVTAAAGVAQADDTCRAKCDQWVTACKRSCADAPVPDECRANCMKVDRECLDQCNEND
jgi:hypothetical protein